MTVSVRVPTILRTYTGDESRVTAEGATLSAVLDSLEDSYPGIKARIVDEDGRLRRFVNIYVAEEDVRFGRLWERAQVRLESDLYTGARPYGLVAGDHPVPELLRPFLP